MPSITFKSHLFRPDGGGPEVLLRLPPDGSTRLPSRGMVMVAGTLNGFPFQAALEPDGHESHWFKVDKSLLDATGAGVGDEVAVAFEPTREWPDPKVPADLNKSLATDSEASAVWRDITPMARWEWIRWIGSAKQPETRKRRVESVCSRLKAGKRRPCCFDRNQCTLTDA